MRIRTKKEYIEICNLLLKSNSKLKDLTINVEINNKAKRYCACMLIKDVAKDIFNIEIHHNWIREKNLTSVIKERDKLKLYFKSLNITKEQLNDALFIRALLHELGHIERFISIKNKCNVGYEEQVRLHKIEFDMFNVIYGRCSDKYVSSYYRTNRSAVECDADAYAFMSFPIVWKKLKQDGYIK